MLVLHTTPQVVRLRIRGTNQFIRPAQILKAALQTRMRWLKIK